MCRRTDAFEPAGRAGRGCGPSLGILRAARHLRKEIIAYLATAASRPTADPEGAIEEALIDCVAMIQARRPEPPDRG